MNIKILIKYFKDNFFKNGSDNSNNYNYKRPVFLSQTGGGSAKRYTKRGCKFRSSDSYPVLKVRIQNQYCC